MKLLFSITGLFLLSATIENCSSKKENNKYKGRLEIAGICRNYTFTLVEGKADTSMVNATWTDETTGISYKNAFGISNPCDFPSDIKVGDEFSFSLDSAQTKDCMVCMAFYPTPSKKLSIKVTSK